jgi:hypothetical protein
MNKTETVKRMIRQVLGLDETDTSRDEEIDRMEPRKALRLCCQWELGDPYWADTFEFWAKSCGLEVK